METILTFLFLVFFVSVFSSTLPDRYFKAFPPSLRSRIEPQEYFELTRPLPSDHLTPSCTHTIIHHSFANTINSPPFTAPYIPPSSCSYPWSHVVLDLHVTSTGDQYDRISGLWLGGAELLRTSTAEPTPSGIFWTVRKDITRYSSLLVRTDLNITMMLENIVNSVYTGIYHVHVNLLFYKNETARVSTGRFLNQGLNGELSLKLGQKHLDGDKISRVSGGLNAYEEKLPADLIIPVSDDGDTGFWFRIESESDLHSKRIRIPLNTRRVILELYVSFHGNDEFWYSNPPNSYIKMNNLTTERGNGAYREVIVTIDGKYAGSEVPFPVIFTGGVNPLFWERIVAIGAFNLPSYDLDLTPFLGLLLDGKSHELGIRVSDGISYWLVDANLHIWLDHDSSRVEAKSVVYNSPAISIERQEVVNQLDGSFTIKAKRESQFGGWVKTSAGNLTTLVSHESKVRSSVKFQSNGTYKVVEQNITVKRDIRVRTDAGSLVTRVFSKRIYPLNVITLALPGAKKDTYRLVTNVYHSFNEKYSNGGFSSYVHNIQESEGWMEVQDHDVQSGESSTDQSFSYRDSVDCYSHTVAAKNGALIRDNSSSSCVSFL